MVDLKIILFIYFDSCTNLVKDLITLIFLYLKTHCCCHYHHSPSTILRSTPLGIWIRIVPTQWYVHHNNLMIVKSEVRSLCILNPWPMHIFMICPFFEPISSRFCSMLIWGCEIFVQQVHRVHWAHKREAYPTIICWTARAC